MEKQLFSPNKEPKITKFGGKLKKIQERNRSLKWLLQFPYFPPGECGAHVLRKLNFGGGLRMKFNL